MGTYYRLVNHRTRQKVEPGPVGGGNIKWNGMVYGSMAHILAFLSIRDDWWRILGDNAYAEYHRCGHEYEDITEEVVTAYNDECPFEEERIRLRTCDMVITVEADMAEPPVMRMLKERGDGQV